MAFWRKNTGNILSVVAGGTLADDVRDIAISANGKTLAVVPRIGEPCLQTAGSGVSRTGTGRAATCVALRPGTRQFAVAEGAQSASLVVYDAGTGMSVCALPVPRAQTVCYSPGGRLLAIGTTDGAIVVFQLTAEGTAIGDGLLRVPARLDRGTITQLCIDDDKYNPFLYAVTSHGEAFKTRVQINPGAREVALLPALNFTGSGLLDVFCLTIAARQNLVAFGTLGHEVWLLNTVNQKASLIESGQTRYTRSLAFRPAASSEPAELALAGSDGVELWSLKNTQVPQCTAQLPAEPGGRFYSVGWCDNNVIAAAAV
jgi:hypothetical protein